MSNVGISFEIIDKNKTAPVGWSKENGHLIYYLKIDYTRKAIWFLEGHRSADPDGSKYAVVIYRDIFCIALTYAAINDIYVLAADI